MTDEIILIGRPATPVTEATDHLVDGILVELSRYNTATLLEIAADRDEINPDGWLQRCIREFVDVWR